MIRLSPLRGDDGQALVETVALLPIMLAVVIGVSSFGVWVVARSAAQGAASAAAIASLQGADGSAAAAASVPAWVRRGLRVDELHGGRVLRARIVTIPIGPWVALATPEAKFTTGPQAAATTVLGPKEIPAGGRS